MRLLLLVDVENLWCGCRDEFGVNMRIDFSKLLSLAIRGRQLEEVKAIAYVVTNDAEHVRKFLHKIKKFGYEVYLEEISHRNRSKIDIKLIMDAVRNQNYDIYVLGSGDGDFLELLEYLKEKGKQVEIICVASDVDKKYLKKADNVQFISRSMLYEAKKGEVR